MNRITSPLLLLAAFFVLMTLTGFTPNTIRLPWNSYSITCAKMPPVENCSMKCPKMSPIENPLMECAKLSFVENPLMESSKLPLTEDPWKASQLLAPADLANTINDPKSPQPLIFCIGPGAVIKNSIDIGPARDSLNLNKLKLKLSKLPKDAPIVIYCGCCPFEHCPNIRPAFSLLNDMKFTHPQLLNIEHNIKTDWISKGYPSIP